MGRFRFLQTGAFAISELVDAIVGSPVVPISRLTCLWVLLLLTLIALCRKMPLRASA